MTTPEIIQSRKPGSTYCANCQLCKSMLEFNLKSPILESPLIHCYSCLKSVQIPIAYLSKLEESAARHTPPKQAPKTFDNERNEKPKRPPVLAGDPLDNSYYELLDIGVDATPAAIKKAYYMAAMKSHPDKNPDDPNAEEKFKEISEAYQVLSDPQRRAFYNQNGKAQQEGAFVDPEQFFKQQFGGEKFVSIIGEISIARDFKDAMAGGGDKDSAAKLLSSEERAIQRKKRVGGLSSHLIQKLELFTNAFPYPCADSEPIGTTMEHLSGEALNSFRILAQVEVDGLKEESYGVELLHAIGYTYVLKSDQWMAIMDSDGSMFQRIWGNASRLSNGIKEKAHILSETVGTVKTAFDLQSSFTKLQEMEKKGAGANGAEENRTELSNEDQELKVKLEQDAAAKGMLALWRGSKLEVEAVLREVCDQTLSEGDVEVRRRRAIALRVLGEVYERAASSP